MNNKKSKLLAISLALVMFLFACSVFRAVPQSGAENPAADTSINSDSFTVTIQNVTLQIISATRQEAYKNPITQKNYTPDDTQKDEVLVVEAKVLSGNIDTVSNWVDVWITDENGRKTTPGSVTTLANGAVIWPIVVQKSSHAFTLHLPDNLTIALDTIVK